jgi:hypothetical protein
MLHERDGEILCMCWRCGQAVVTYSLLSPVGLFHIMGFDAYEHEGFDS